MTEASPEQFWKVALFRVLRVVANRYLLSADELIEWRVIRNATRGRLLIAFPVRPQEGIDRPVFMFDLSAIFIHTRDLPSHWTSWLHRSAPNDRIRESAPGA